MRTKKKVPSYIQGTATVPLVGQTIVTISPPVSWGSDSCQETGLGYGR
jgi:hypothetical protein